MTYATYQDIEERRIAELSEDEKKICNSLLEDAAVMIDSYNKDAELEIKKLVSCRMVIRAISNLDEAPIGATQGTMSALGYSQTWSLTNGSVGELYISKSEKKLLGTGNKIGSYSPIEGMV